MILSPLVWGPPLSSTLLNGSLAARALQNHQVGRNKVRWGFKEGGLPRLVCSFVLFMLSLPALPRQLLPIALFSSFCLSPGSFSSVWKHAQVSAILNKALLDLMLSPTSFTAYSLLNTHNSVGTALQDIPIALNSPSFTSEHLLRIPFQV